MAQTIVFRAGFVCYVYFLFQLKDNGMRYDAIHDPKQKKLHFTKTPRKIRSPQKLPKSPANVVVSFILSILVMRVSEVVELIIITC